MQAHNFPSHSSWHQGGTCSQWSVHTPRQLSLSTVCWLTVLFKVCLFASYYFYFWSWENGNGMCSLAGMCKWVKRGMKGRREVLFNSMELLRCYTVLYQSSIRCLYLNCIIRDCGNLNKINSSWTLTWLVRLRAFPPWPFFTFC